jgi:hypothetical protein
MLLLQLLLLLLTIMAMPSSTEGTPSMMNSHCRAQADEHGRQTTRA